MLLELVVWNSRTQSKLCYHGKQPLSICNVISICICHTQLEWFLSRENSWILYREEHIVLRLTTGSVSSVVHIHIVLFIWPLTMFPRYKVLLLFTSKYCNCCEDVLMIKSQSGHLYTITIFVFSFDKYKNRFVKRKTITKQGWCSAFYGHRPIEPRFCNWPRKLV